MGAKPFQDSEVKKELYLLQYPLLAWSYTQYCQAYTHHKERTDRTYRRVKDSFHVERSRELASWLLDLLATWNANAVNKKLVHKHPEDEALGQVTLLRELDSVIDGDIFTRKFRCSDETVHNYITVRKQFIEPTGTTPAYMRARPRKGTGRIYLYLDSESLYWYAISVQAFPQYVIQHYCGQNVPGKVILRGAFSECTGEEKKTKTSEQCLEDQIRLRYKEEINILEKEIFKGKG